MIENDVPYQFLTYTRIANGGTTLKKFKTECCLDADGRDEKLSVTASTPDTNSSSGNPEEQQYLQLIQRILHSGVRRGDRTGIGESDVCFMLCRNFLCIWCTNAVFTSRWNGTDIVHVRCSWMSYTDSVTDNETCVLERCCRRASLDSQWSYGFQHVVEKRRFGQHSRVIISFLADLGCQWFTRILGQTWFHVSKTGVS